MRKKPKSRGLLTLERTVYPLFHKLAVTSGWTTTRISKSDIELHDDTIAKKYGKGRSILLTHDKTAYTQNVEGGFKGYIVCETVDKKAFQLLEKSMQTVLTTDTGKTLAGYQTIVKETGYEKEKLP